MAIRQYIGARYVPRFMGTYDATQIYDALDVVDNGSGTSYIARKTVPAGTPLTDTDHWFIYGASSGAIIALQNDMIQAQNDITDLQMKKRGNILILGNSYVHYGVCDILKKNFDNAYEYYSSGMGFSTFTGHSQTFSDLLDTAIADTSFDNDTITDILVVSAVGDSAAVTELSVGTWATNTYATMAAMQTKIASSFTNVKRVALTLAEIRDVASYSLHNFTDIFNVHFIFKREAYKYGFEYIGWSGFNFLFDASLVQGDHMHPTAAGNLAIGTWINAAYFGKAEYTKHRGSNNNCPFNYTSGSLVGVNMSFDPDTVFVNLRRISITGGSVTAVANTTLVDSNDLNIPMPGPNTLIPIYTPLTNSATNAQIDYMQIIFERNSDGTLKIYTASAPTQSTVTTQYASLTGFNCVQFPIVN